MNLNDQDDLRLFDQLWRERQPDAPAMVEFWNNRAASFNKLKNELEGQSCRQELVEKLSQLATLDSNAQVLDIGCGPGHHSLLLARKAGRVVGLDLSPKMIELARDNAQLEKAANVDFETLDWNAVNLDERGWKRKFRLVLASRTQAVNDLAALRKMTDACNGLCCLISQADSSNSLRDRLKPLAGWDDLAARTSRGFFCVFNLLWLMGFHPTVSYLDRHWENELSLSEARTIYGLHFESLFDLAEEQKEAIAAELAKMAESGPLIEKVRSKVAVVAWTVPRVESS
ncbi:MAG: methyltransferase domain-containing protein [Deltaproteobacteria bacterium]|jgi:SAM-dependent methyltransferase|nr:methyltransferase domain-containing protein [Deltaproteobacteria bacterium]